MVTHGWAGMLVGVLVGMCVLLPAQAQAEPVWVLAPPEVGDWFDAANWDEGVPNLGWPVIDNGGTAEIAYGAAQATTLVIGQSATGFLSQTGGTATIQQALLLGVSELSHGTYDLSNTGELFNLGTGPGVQNVYIGLKGGGLFRQSGGAHYVATGLYLGYDAGGSGRYELSGGTLEAGVEYIGFDGSGTFAQSNGTNQADYLVVAPASTYELTGGRLEVHGGSLNGILDMTGGTGLIALESGILDISGADIRGGSGTTFQGSANSLLVYSGDPLSSLFGTFHTDGLVHVPGQTLVVPAGTEIRGRGTIVGHVQCEGVLLRERPLIGLLVRGGLKVQGGATADLDYMNGSLWVEDEQSGLDDGTFTAQYTYVGKTGKARFVQTDGTFDSDLVIGVDAGSEGTYELRGGVLKSSHIYVGRNGKGLLAQTGGSIQGCYTLQVRGTYELGGTGYCGSKFLFVGWGSGHFTQSGGSLWSWLLEVGHKGEGSCELQGGTFAIDSMQIGTDAAGSVVQTGGDYTVNECLYVGAKQNVEGTYELRGGNLTTGGAHVGEYGIGRFIHTGGAILGGWVCVGYLTSGNGTYELRDGEVRASVSVGYDGTGRLVQSGGSIVGNNLGVGDAAGMGWLTQSGGTVSVNNLSVGSKGEGLYELQAAEVTATAVKVGCGGTGRLTQSGGSLSAKTLDVGATPGTLEILGPGAILTVSERFRLEARASLTAAPNTRIHMVGATFENQSKDEAALADLESVETIFEAGTGGVSSFEVASYDWLKSLDPADRFVKNFALGGLTVGSKDPAYLMLVDLYDNGNRQITPWWLPLPYGPTLPEALYVHNLTVGLGSTLDLNGLTLYYDTRYINLGTVTGGKPIFIPEPATLGLLAAGLAALLRRRR